MSFSRRSLLHIRQGHLDLVHEALDGSNDKVPLNAHIRVLPHIRFDDHLLLQSGNVVLGLVSLRGSFGVDLVFEAEDLLAEGSEEGVALLGALDAVGATTTGEEEAFGLEGGFGCELGDLEADGLGRGTEVEGVGKGGERRRRRWRDMLGDKGEVG